MTKKPRYQQARYIEPSVFEHDAPGRIGHEIPKPDKTILDQVGSVDKLIPKDFTRRNLELPRLSEVEVINHYVRLSQMNYGVDLGLYPLGSCTMKYNPKVNEYISSLEHATFIHPEQDLETAQGALEIMYTLQEWLAEICGMGAVTLQPAAGAHGEFTGLMMIRAYHKKRNALDTRLEMLVPDAAHGTNPATAKMCGFNVVKLPSNDQGLVD
ncbi:MAG: aminomethyl-transferring glycine dehydrogenase subunit GcvPB, partial [Candidatus Ranarchaeia archaeon]